MEIIGKDYKESHIVNVMCWFDKFGATGLAVFVLLSPLLYAALLPIDVYNLETERKEEKTMPKTIGDTFFVVGIVFLAVLVIDYLRQL